MSSIGHILPRNHPKPRIKLAVWFGLFMIGLMLLSSFAFVLDYKSTQNVATSTYGNYTFTPAQNKWKTEINGNDLTFTYLPEQLEHTNISLDAIQILQSTRVFWITYDPYSEFSDLLGGIQYTNDDLLKLGKQMYVQRALLNNSEYPDLPQINCGNATVTEPVLMFMQANETNLNIDKSCIIISAANDEDFLKLNERLMYSILGVMQ